MRSFAAIFLLGGIGLVFGGDAGASRVELKLDAPKGLDAYSGTQPILTGVPFPEGELKAGEALRLVNGEGKELPGQFEVTATWKPDGKEVRWLLVDGLVSLVKGQPEKVYLEYGPGVTSTGRPSAFAVKKEDGKVTVDTGAKEYLFGREGNTGQFVFQDGSGREYEASDWKVEVEKEGPVRCVVKMTGRYLDAGGKLIGEFVTRYRLYAGQSYARVFHTFIWQTDDKTEIGKVAYRSTPFPGAKKASAGVDGTARDFAADEDVLLRQISAHEVAGAGKRLDGWVLVEDGKTSAFAALRWPWQQFPTAVGVEKGRLAIDFIGPERPMSLRPTDVAFPEANDRIKQWNLNVWDVTKVYRKDRVAGGVDALDILTPRGAARTWEMVLWDEAVPPAEAKNTLTQHPVLACADPAFATRAGLPSPMSPKDTKAFPKEETALDSAFDWFTRELESEYDFGTWNYGDIQWNFTERGGNPVYRYWMNNGKGWSILPWILWMRSGERKYLENAEANSRHCMDVDMSHVPEWDGGPPDYRMRGGHYHYSAIHWGYGTHVYNFWVDSEYLPYAYYLTGNERAKDCLLLHAEALACYKGRDMMAKWFRADLPKTASRPLYVMVKNLGVMYEATWDSRLKEAFLTWLDLTKQAQDEKGNLPGIKSNHYLDQSLNIAARIVGWEPMKDTIKKWYDFNGSPLYPGPYGGNRGPCSLWSAINLARHGEGKKYFEDAQADLLAQTSTVAVCEGAWNGLNKIPAHLAGPALRDWVIALAARREASAAELPATYQPIEGFSSLIAPVAKDREEGFTCRHLAYVLNEDGKDFQLDVYASRPVTAGRIRVYAPDGQVVLELNGGQGWSALTVGQRGAAGQKIRGDKDLLTLSISAEDRKGAYAIELLTTTKPGLCTPFGLKSSTGKVVHCLPAGRGNFYSTDIKAGQFWFKPEPDSVRVGISNVDGNTFVGITRILDAKGNELAASRLTGGRPFVPPKNSRVITAELPVGTWCELSPAADAAPQVLSVVMPSDTFEHAMWRIQGMKPFVSATQAEWFNPEDHACLPLQQLVGDGKPLEQKASAEDNEQNE